MAEEIRKNVVISVQTDTSEATADLDKLKKKTEEATTPSNQKGTDSFKTFKAAIKDARTQAEELTISFGKNNVKTQEAIKRYAELKDQYKEFGQTVDSYNPDNKFQSLATAARAAVGTIQGVQGAMTFLGVSSKTAEESIAKLQGLMAFSNALNSIDDIKNAWKDFTRVIGGATIAQKVNQGATKASIAIMRLFGVATDATSTSVKFLSKALITTGIGAAVVAIGFLIGKIQDWIEKSNEQKKIQEELNKSTNEAFIDGYKNAIQNIDKVKDALDNARNGVITKEAALKIYNDTLGQSIGYVNSLEEAENSLAANAEAYIQAAGAKAAAERAFGSFVEAEAALRAENRKKGTAEENKELQRSLEEKYIIALNNYKDLEALAKEYSGKISANVQTNFNPQVEQEITNLQDQNALLRIKNGRQREEEQIRQQGEAAKKRIKETVTTGDQQTKALTAIEENTQLKLGEIRTRYGNQALQELRQYQKQNRDLANDNYLRTIQDETFRQKEKVRIDYENAQEEAKRTIKNKTELDKYLRNLDTKFALDNQDIDKKNQEKRLKFQQDTDKLIVQNRIASLKDSRFKAIFEYDVQYQEELDALYEQLNNKEITQKEFDDRMLVMQEQYRLGKDAINTEWDQKDAERAKEKRDKDLEFEQKQFEEEKRILQARFEYRQFIYGKIGELVGTLGNFFEQGSKTQKAFAKVEVGINTALALWDVFRGVKQQNTADKVQEANEAAGIALTFAPVPGGQAIAQGLINANKIRHTATRAKNIVKGALEAAVIGAKAAQTITQIESGGKGGGGGTGGGGTEGGSPAPSATAPTIQAASTGVQQAQDVRVVNQQGQQPIRAYITDRDLRNNEQRTKFLNQISTF